MIDNYDPWGRTSTGTVYVIVNETSSWRQTYTGTYDNWPVADQAFLNEPSRIEPAPGYRFYKAWCPPPTSLALCTKPMPERRPPTTSFGTAWLARVARTPQRERRAIRARVERKDAA